MELLNTWLPPAAIISVIIYTNRVSANGLNKRIDDLRSQMTREHDTLAKKVDALDTRLSTRLDSLNQNFIKHLETHGKSKPSTHPI